MDLWAKAFLHQLPVHGYFRCWSVGITANVWLLPRGCGCVLDWVRDGSDERLFLFYTSSPLFFLPVHGYFRCWSVGITANVWLLPRGCGCVLDWVRDGSDARLFLFYTSSPLFFFNTFMNGIILLGDAKSNYSFM